MNKNNTKAIRIDDNDLLLIRQYKNTTDDIKTDSDAIRELIKDGLSFNNINNKSFIHYLTLIRDDDSKLNNDTHRSLANDLLSAINRLRNVDLFVNKYFYDNNKNKLIFDYDSFLSKCLVNDNEFINDLQDVLLNQYFSSSEIHYSSYTIKSTKLIDLINFCKFNIGIKDLNNIKNRNEIDNLLVDCHYILLEDKSSSEKTYLYNRHEYMNLHCDIIANCAYVFRQNVDDYQFYQKTKELFLLLNELYINSSKIKDLT